MLSFPIPLRLLLAAHPHLLSPVLRVVNRAISSFLTKRAGLKRPQAVTGAVTLIQRFGSAANPHLHFHCCVFDGLFEAEPESDGQIRFSEAVGLSAQEVAAVQAQVRRRVLRWFVRRGWLSEQDRQEMQRWAHSGGFSVDAEVRIEAWDRDGLERLLR